MARRETEQFLSSENCEIKDNSTHKQKLLMVKIWLSILTLICLLCVALCAYFISWEFENSRNLELSYNNQYKESGFCFDCELLKPISLKEMTKVTTGLSKTCCIHEDNVTEFLKKYTNFQIKLQLDKEEKSILETGNFDTSNYGSSKPLAHLAIDQAVSDNSDRILIHWLPPKNNNTFLKNGMSLYRRRYLRIPVSGRYFVYSQATFLGDLDNKVSGCTHYIIRIHNNGQTDEVKSGVVTDHDLHEYSSYLGVACILKQGDYLAVQTSQCRLSTDEHSTFVGIFML